MGIVSLELFVVDKLLLESDSRACHHREGLALASLKDKHTDSFILNTIMMRS